MSFNKIYPYLLVGIAVLGVVLQYRFYNAMTVDTEECSCQKDGPITD